MVLAPDLGKPLAVLAVTLSMALATVGEPWLGVALLAIFWFYTASFIWPMTGFLLVYGAAMLMNINIVNDSPIRILSERYPIFLPLPLLLLPVIMGRLLVRHPPDQIARLEPIDALPLFFLFWTLSSYGWTMDVYHGMNMGLNLLLGVGVYFLILHYVKNRRGLEITLVFTLFWGIALALMLVFSNKIDTSIFQTLHIQLAPDWSFEPGLIIYGTRAGGFAPPQIAGTITTFIFMIGCALWPRFRWKGKILLALMAPFLISNILATGSKGAAGAFIIAFMVFLTVYPGLKVRRALLILAFLISLVCILIFNVIVFEADRLTAGADLNELSITFRLEFWQAGFALLEQRWIGAGVGGFAHLVDPWPGAHNYYLSILFDTGLVGFVLLLGFILSMAIALIRTITVTSDKDLRRYLFCLGAALLAFFIHATVDFSYDSSFVWLLYGTTMAAIRIARRDEQTANPPL